MSKTVAKIIKLHQKVRSVGFDPKMQPKYEERNRLLAQAIKQGENGAELGRLMGLSRQRINQLAQKAGE